MSNKSDGPDALDSCCLFVGVLLLIAFVLGAGVWSMFTQLVRNG